MNVPISRRRYLQMAGVASLSGCLRTGEEGTGTERSIPTGVPMLRYNPARTGGPLGATGPTDSVTEQWTVQTDGGIGYSLAVFDDTVYVGSNDRAVSALAEIGRAHV